MRDTTRLFSYLLLTQVFQHQRSLEEALNLLPPAEARDRAAAHRIAATVLRHAGSLDAVLEPFLRRAPPEPVRQILRIGAAGLLLLETPPHAAVATAVELARHQKLDSFTGLVNAVLRRVATEGPQLLADLDVPRLDTPAWLWTAYGPNARAIATAEGQEAPIDLTFKPGAPLPPVGEPLPTGSLRFPPGTRVADLPGYAEGDFWVQDAAAALPARLLAVRPGERVADLCAAPGGKTMQLAAAGGLVSAVEKSPERATRLCENLSRLDLNVEVIVADATEWAPGPRFDAILLDAPCSATGTGRRHPDVKHLKRAHDLAGLNQIQDRLLDHARALLKPGGRLIYAVCSLLPGEGRDRIAEATRRGWKPQPFTESELACLPEARTADGMLFTHPGLWPGRGGMDGFFAARLTL